MDNQTRLEIDTITRRLTELESSIKTIRTMVKVHQRVLEVFHQILGSERDAHHPL